MPFDHSTIGRNLVAGADAQLLIDNLPPTAPQLALQLDAGIDPSDGITREGTVNDPREAVDLAITLRLQRRQQGLSCRQDQAVIHLPQGAVHCPAKVGDLALLVLEERGLLLLAGVLLAEVVVVVARVLVERAAF